MKVAVVGCLHGKLTQIYEDVRECEKHQGFLIDVVIVCGDFQAVRNVNDLKCMAVPDKYKELGDFHKFHSGELEASHLTLVIGGNHEASNYFQQLPYGGWIAKNIFYMGYSNVVKVNGVRIGGISGIYNYNCTSKGHFEYLPYSQSTMRSAYYTRYLEVFRMLQLKEKLDILFTHDWPLHIYNQQPRAKEFLLQKKPFFKEDINNNRLGSPQYEILLNRIKPKNWFAAHLHVRFQTNYVHQSNNSNNVERTHFLALDKCLHKRTYLEIVNIQSDEFNTDGLQYDLEWLALLKLTNEFVSIQEYPTKQIPRPHIFMNYDVNEAIPEIKKAFDNDFTVPHNFAVSLPLRENGEDIDPNRQMNFVNEQSTRFCERLGITDPNQRIVNLIEGKVNNPDRISISDDEDVDWIEDVRRTNNTNNTTLNKQRPKTEPSDRKNVTIVNVSTNYHINTTQNTNHHSHYYCDPSDARISQRPSTSYDRPSVRVAQTTNTNCNELVSSDQIEVNGVIIKIKTDNDVQTNYTENRYENDANIRPSTIRTNEQTSTNRNNEKSQQSNYSRNKDHENRDAQINKDQPATKNGSGYERQIKKEKEIPQQESEQCKQQNAEDRPTIRVKAEPDTEMFVDEPVQSARETTNSEQVEQQHEEDRPTVRVKAERNAEMFVDEPVQSARESTTTGQDEPQHEQQHEHQDNNDRPTIRIKAERNSEMFVDNEPVQSAREPTAREPTTNVQDEQQNDSYRPTIRIKAERNTEMFDDEPVQSVREPTINEQDEQQREPSEPIRKKVKEEPIETNGRKIKKEPIFYYDKSGSN